MVIRSKAPLRISFGGGGTDVSPYREERGGVVLSTTIDKYCYASLTPRDDDQVCIRSLDYDTTVRYQRDQMELDGRLDLIKATLAALDAPGGCELLLHSDAPPGSGLGSSSAMVVAVLGAVLEWTGARPSPYEVAQLAYRIERCDLGIPGGYQDQYAATFGGVNWIEFGPEEALVNPLRVDPGILNELHYRLLLCYTGKIRASVGIVNEQVSGYIERRPQVSAALDETKRLAGLMKAALLRGELDCLGRLLHEAWQQKQKFSVKITDPEIDALYEGARRAGAIGGKLLGAGGGGYLLLLAESAAKHRLADNLTAAGGQLIDFSLEAEGRQCWRFALGGE